MSVLDLSIIIKAVDRISAPITRINNHIGKSLRPVRLLNARLANLEKQSGMDKISAATRRLGKNLVGVGNEVKSLGFKLAAITAGAGFAFKRLFVDTAAEFERFETILVTLEGTSQKAKASMNWISKFTANTPNELTDVTEAFVRLRANGLDPTNGLLKILGDTSAAMGKPLIQSVEAIADAVTGENERLKEFGIKAYVKGTQTAFAFTNKAGEQQTKIVDNRNRKMIESTLQAIWNEKYGGSMKRLSKTWTGMMSNISDWWTIFANKVMSSGVFDFMTGKLKGILEYFNRIAANGDMDKLAKAFGQNLSTVLENLWAVLVVGWDIMRSVGSGLKWLRDLFGSWKPIIIALGAVIAGPLILSLISAAAAVKVLGVALLTTPVGWIMAAIAAIAGAVVLIYQNWEPIADFFAGLWSGIKKSLANSIGWITDRLKTALSWITEKIKALTSWMPDWVKKKLNISNNMTTSLAKAQPTLTSNAPTTNQPMRGELVVRIDQDNRASVKKTKTENLDLDIDNGLVMMP